MATIYTIPRKMSGTGTIHDIASDVVDRDIRFASGCKYAVVRAAYYGGKGYTTHKSGEAAIAAARRLGGDSYQIIDANGNRYAIQSGYLEDYLYRV